MIRGAVLYKGTWLAPGSAAFALHQAGEFKKLDEHLKGLQ